MTAQEYKERIDCALVEYFAPCGEQVPTAGLAEAMRYSLLAGGKRIRPMLVLEFCRIAGGDVEAALELEAPALDLLKLLHEVACG